MNGPTQHQLFEAAHRNVAAVNDTFLELVKDGLTREELQRNIARRPSLWQRYEHWLPHLPSGYTTHDKPLAAEGYTSYRYKGRYGWIMIGAKDTDDALNEARRSTHDPVTVDGLQVWGGSEYVAVSV